MFSSNILPIQSTMLHGLHMGFSERKHSFVISVVSIELIYSFNADDTYFFLFLYLNFETVVTD